MLRLFPGGTLSKAELLGLKTLDFLTLDLYCQISPKQLFVAADLLTSSESKWVFFVFIFLINLFN